MPIPLLAGFTLAGAKAGAAALIGNVKFWLYFTLIAVVLIAAVKLHHDMVVKYRAEGRAEAAQTVAKLTAQVNADADGFRQLRGVFEQITARARFFKAEQAAALKRAHDAGAADKRAQRLVHARDAAFAAELGRAAKRSDRCAALLDLDLTAQLRECGLQ